MIGAAVPKNFYNSFPLKHEVINLLMLGEILYHEDPKFFRAGRRPIIRYNKIHYLHNIFQDLAEAGIPMLSFINSFSCTFRTDNRLCSRPMILTHHPLIWMIICSVMLYIRCLYIPDISQPGWMKLDPGSSKLIQSSLGVQVNPCENVLESNMERHRLITSQ